MEANEEIKRLQGENEVLRKIIEKMRGALSEYAADIPSETRVTDGFHFCKPSIGTIARRTLASISARLEKGK